MDAEQAGRLDALIDTLDREVAARPDLLLSMVGQALGMLVATHRSKGGEWLYGQVVGFGDAIDAVRAWVERGDGDPLDVLGRFIGAA